LTGRLSTFITNKQDGNIATIQAMLEGWIITDHYNNYINYKNYTIRERELQELHFTGEG
jgi:hypothetical protein